MFLFDRIMHSGFHCFSNNQKDLRTYFIHCLLAFFMLIMFLINCKFIFDYDCKKKKTILHLEK